MPIQPLYDRVIVRSLEKSQTTASGIVIPGVNDRPDQGTVVAVGAGHVLQDGTQRPLTVKPGDQVIFDERSGAVVTVDGEELLVFLENELIGIIV
jgi:chaperonin GroES